MRAVSSAGERRVDIAKVSGSIPLPPTILAFGGRGPQPQSHTFDPRVSASRTQGSMANVMSAAENEPAAGAVFGRRITLTASLG
jgi:hypothetical protein